MTDHPRLVLAEDHRETAELLRDLLQPEFAVVSLVQDGEALVSAVERLSPDAIVTDITMPRLDGISAANAILRRDPSARIVFVSVHEGPLVARCFAIGGLGFVAKVAAGDELVPAVRAALCGQRYVSRGQHRTGDEQGVPEEQTRMSGVGAPRQ